MDFDTNALYKLTLTLTLDFWSIYFILLSRSDR